MIYFFGDTHGCFNHVIDVVGQDRPAAGRAEVKSQYALACQCLSPPAYLLERTSASYFLTISSHSSSVPALFRLQ